MFEFKFPSLQPLLRVGVELSDGRKIHPVVRELHPPPTQQQLAEHQAMVAAALNSIQESLVELEQRRQQSLVELQQFAIEMSVEIASQVVNQQLEANDTLVVKLAEKAIEKLGATGNTQLHLHPADAAILQAIVAEAESLPEVFQNITIAANPNMPRGGCQATSDRFGLRIDPAAHLDTIRQTLLEQLNDAQTERRGNEASDRGMRRFPDRRETA